MLLVVLALFVIPFFNVFFISGCLNVGRTAMLTHSRNSGIFRVIVCTQSNEGSIDLTAQFFETPLLVRRHTHSYTQTQTHTQHGLHNKFPSVWAISCQCKE